jgi:hypothetical protein
MDSVALTEVETAAVDTVAIGADSPEADTPAGDGDTNVDWFVLAGDMVDVGDADVVSDWLTLADDEAAGWFVLADGVANIDIVPLVDNSDVTTAEADGRAPVRELDTDEEAVAE